MGRLIRWGAAGVASTLLIYGLAYPFLSPDLQRGPRYAWEFATNDNFVVNTPVLHEIFGHAVGVPDESTFASRLRPPPGFTIGVYADEIAHPRSLRFTAAGDLIVTQPRKGRVLLLDRDADEDGRSDGMRVLLEGLSLPHGIEVKGDWLYVAEPHTVHRVRLDSETGALAGPLERVLDLPQTAHHNMRVLRFGPDGWLYVPIGANCNICELESDREGVILRARPDGSEAQVFATGFRNIFGLDWRPATGDLYALDIGADYRGDDFPPEELNRVEEGGFYGFPYAHGARVPDPELGGAGADRIATSLAPAHEFGAHTTPLGVAFLRDPGQPEGYRGAAVVAFHGSWNRTRKSGYRLASLHFDAEGRVEERDFVTGFELDEDVIGRPVDVIEGPDAAIYVSDDYAGAIYRIYSEPRVSASGEPGSS